jgi:hypothetical protein
LCSAGCSGFFLLACILNIAVGIPNMLYALSFNKTINFLLVQSKNT